MDLIQSGCLAAFVVSVAMHPSFYLPLTKWILYVEVDEHRLSGIEIEDGLEIRKLEASSKVASS